MNRFVGIAVSCALFGGSAVVAAQASRSASNMATAIGAQPLATALEAVGRQTGLQIVYVTEVVHGKHSPGAPAGLDPRKALERVLQGTGLTYRFLTDRTVSIRAVDSANSPRASAPASSSPALRLAQAESSTASTPAPDSPSANAEISSMGSFEIEEVVVTGSHIRGAQAAGSKLIVMDREAIDATGYGRVQDVLATLTQNFQGVSESFTQPTGVYNFNRGAEVQLRGLGPGTTLTLVNGQRLGSGGQRGSMTDISSIATSAVERIEILPEGASALYGSDAIGGVVNVILRKDFDGMETRLRAGTADGDADERQFAHLWGNAWENGNLLLGYQYNEREALPASSRKYSAANDDLRPFGGSDFRQLGSNPGTILNSALQPIAAIPAGQDGTNLTSGQLIQGAVNYADLVSHYSVLPEQKQHTGFVHASYDPSERWGVFVDARYGTRQFELRSANSRRNLTVPASNAFNRLGGTVRVAYDFTDDLGVYTLSGTTDSASVVAGGSAALSSQWKVKLSGAHARERNAYRTDNAINSTVLNQYLASSDPAVALNVFGDGSHTNAQTLSALRSSSYELSVGTTTSANVIVDGPLLTTPGGLLRAAVGADFRREHVTHLNPASNIDRNVSRDVSALFTEFSVPLIGPRENADASGARLELSLAGRYEDYQDAGTTFDPKLGVSWRPFEALKVRGTWGTSFRAPPFHLADAQFQSSFAQVRTVSDPRSTAPNGTSQVLVLGGAFPDITEETADVWTAGVDIAPPFAQSLKLSMTIFDVSYQGKIQHPGSHTTFLTQEEQFAPLITRNPTRDEVDAICNNSPVPPGNCNQPIAAILDSRVRNLSGVRTRGVDADMDYSWGTRVGKIGVGLRGTYTFDYKTKLTSTAPEFEVIDTLNNPLAMRLAGTASWGFRDWTARATVNHAGAYQNPGTVPESRIDSWTTVDLNLSYSLGSYRDWIDDARFYLSAINLFDKEPPFVNQAGVFGYDGANASLLGRQLGLQIVMGW